MLLSVFLFSSILGNGKPGRVLLHSVYDIENDTHRQSTPSDNLLFSSFFIDDLL